MKGEKYFENIHENYVPNFKDHVLSTFVTKENEVRVVPNSKHFFALEFHSEEENVLEVLSDIIERKGHKSRQGNFTLMNICIW